MGKWSLTHSSVGEGTLKTVLWTVLLKVRKFGRVSLKDVDVEIEDFDDVRVRYFCDLEMAVLSLMKSILELSLLIISILVLITLETYLETIFIFLELILEFKYGMNKSVQSSLIWSDLVHDPVHDRLKSFRLKPLVNRSNSF